MREKPRLEWRPHALADLLNIVAHIADDNPDAAHQVFHARRLRPPTTAIEP